MKRDDIVAERERNIKLKLSMLPFDAALMQACEYDDYEPKGKRVFVAWVCECHEGRRYGKVMQ